MKPLSFRLRAALIISAAFILFLTAFFSLSYFAVGDSLLARGDREVHEQLELILDNLHPAMPADSVAAVAAQYGFTGEAVLAIRIVDKQDNALLSQTGPGNAMEALMAARFAPQDSFTTVLLHEKEYRCFRSGHDRFEAAAAMDTRVLAETQDTMIGEFGMLLLIGTIISFGLGYVVAGYSLRPFQRLLQAARKIEHEPFPTQMRLPLTDRVAEIAELAGTMNTILNNRDASIAKLSAFSADVSHELRTPLTTMKGELEVELKLVASDEQRDILTSLLEEVERLIAIVEDLLLLSEIEQEETVRDMLATHVSLESTLRSLSARSSRLAAERGITFVVDDSLPHSVELSIPALRLERMLFNVILNAITFTPEAGNVTLKTYQAKDGIRIEVTDTGKGIAAEDLRHIFDRFWRAEHSRSRSLGGAGLGLAITKSIADRYGISLSIESQPGRGTTVFFVIPSGRIVV